MKNGPQCLFFLNSQSSTGIDAEFTTIRYLALATGWGLPPPNQVPVGSNGVMGNCPRRFCPDGRPIGSRPQGHTSCHVTAMSPHAGTRWNRMIFRKPDARKINWIAAGDTSCTPIRRLRFPLAHHRLIQPVFFRLPERMKRRNLTTLLITRPRLRAGFHCYATATVAKSLDPEGRWKATTIGYRGPGGQNRPVRDRVGPQPNLGRGLSRLQLRIPARAQPA